MRILSEVQISLTNSGCKDEIDPKFEAREPVLIDLVGSLPRSTRGDNYLVDMQDRFTEWIICRTVRKATSQATSKALYEETDLRFGCPKIVISDNDTQFTGTPFRELLRDLNIKHHLTSPYTPQTNPVERANKTVKTTIAKFCNQDQR